MKVKCPQCGGPVVFLNTNQWRPFCSERCKLIDFGDWINEKKIISDDLASIEKQANNTGNFKH